MYNLRWYQSLLQDLLGHLLSGFRHRAHHLYPHTKPRSAGREGGVKIPTLDERWPEDIKLPCPSSQQFTISTKVHSEPVKKATANFKHKEALLLKALQGPQESSGA